MYTTKKNNRGFSLVEVMLSIALFALVAGAFTGAIIYGQQTAVLAGQQARAALVLEEGLEAARNIRDADFNNLQDGTFGLVVNNGAWEFSGSNDVTDIFTRTVEISPTASTSTKDILVTVTWQKGQQRTGELAASTRLGDWRE